MDGRKGQNQCFPGLSLRFFPTRTLGSKAAGAGGSGIPASAKAMSPRDAAVVEARVFATALRLPTSQG